MPPRMVLLEHTLPSGEMHFDWMFERPAVADGPLVSFRTWQRPDLLPGGSHMLAERIGDHRPAYLEYEGPVSNGRGSVRRLARATVLALDDSTPLIWLSIRWESGTEQRWKAHPLTTDTPPSPGCERWIWTRLS